MYSRYLSLSVTKNVYLSPVNCGQLAHLVAALICAACCFFDLMEFLLLMSKMRIQGSCFPQQKFAFIHAPDLTVHALSCFQHQSLCSHHQLSSLGKNATPEFCVSKNRAHVKCFAVVSQSDWTCGNFLARLIFRKIFFHLYALSVYRSVPL